MEKFLNATINANKEIIKLIATNQHSYLCEEISLGAGGDISRRVDLLAEEIFIKHLKKFGNIYSEECGFVDSNSEFKIIIDPIDGSDNFASNLPYFGTSVALKHGNRPMLSVIVNLANGDIFYKDKDRFQKANMEFLDFKDVQNNSFSKIGIFERSYCSKNLFDKLRAKNLKFRSPGAFALSLSYAHEVNFVVYEGNIRLYDVEAGLYMCEDLYKIVTKDKLLISKNKEIFDKISQLFIKGGEKI